MESVINETSSIPFYSGNLDTVKPLIDRYGLSNPPFWNTHDILREAINENRTDIVELLLDHGVKVYEDTLMFSEPLIHVAVRADNIKMIELLLTMGADINVVFDHRTPLHIAVQKDPNDVVHALLKHKADPNRDVKAYNNPTPLFYSVISCNKEITEMLLENGIDPNASCPFGVTSLHIACQFGHIEVLEILLDRGCVLDYKNDNINDIVEALLFLIDTDVRTYEISPLLTASRCGYPRAFQLLLNYGADVNGYLIPSDEDSFDETNETDSECDEIAKCHIYKLKALDLSLSSYALEFVKKNFEYEDTLFINRCKREIEDMRNDKMTGTNLSFYDLLTKDVQRVAIYASNGIWMEVLESGDYKEKYDIYSDMIDLNLKKARRRQILLSPSVEAFDLLTNFKLPDVLTIDIFNYLSDVDLARLIKACPTT